MLREVRKYLVTDAWLSASVRAAFVACGSAMTRRASAFGPLGAIAAPDPAGVVVVGVELSPHAVSARMALQARPMAPFRNKWMHNNRSRDSAHGQPPLVLSWLMALVLRMTDATQ